MRPITSSRLRGLTLLCPAPFPTCWRLGRSGLRFMMTTMISRFCPSIVLTLAATLAQDVAFFREYGAGPGTEP